MAHFYTYFGFPFFLLILSPYTYNFAQNYFSFYWHQFHKRLTNYTVNKHVETTTFSWYFVFGRHNTDQQFTVQTINNNLHTAEEDYSKVDKDCQIANQWQLAQRSKSGIRYAYMSKNMLYNTIFKTLEQLWKLDPYCTYFSTISETVS